MGVYQRITEESVTFLPPTLVVDTVIDIIQIEKE
jgi:hypothetical protein